MHVHAYGPLAGITAAADAAAAADDDDIKEHGRQDLLWSPGTA